MRDKRFVAIHRGGELSMEHHRLLIKWAVDCAKHVLPLLGECIDDRLEEALIDAILWERGEISVGLARKASVDAHAVARESSNPVGIAVARAVGHVVATSHMADHSLGAACYALKAVKYTNKSIEEEIKWQEEQLPSDIKELIISSQNLKFKRKIT
jgi:hypothetical protein